MEGGGNDAKQRINKDWRHEMKTVVEVYVRSFAIPKDIESLHYAQQHTYCAPGMAERTLGLLGFSDRVLEPDSAELLSLLSAA
jgi:hypothetical protein